MSTATTIGHEAAKLDRTRRSGCGVESTVRALLERHGLTESDLLQLVAREGADAAAAARALFSGVPAGRDGLQRVLRRLEHTLGEHVDTSGLVTPLDRARKRATDVLGVALGFGCVGLVIGGLAQGAGWLGAPTGIIVFGFVLTLLAVFEALHVAAVQIRRADLGALEMTHGRAVRLHALLRAPNGIDRFLAGRQIVVILTVFFVARLSSFSELRNVPLTSLALPHAVQIVVELGLPGALFVLWFGQLAPQFIATRLALRLVNSRLGWFACRIALALGGTAFARPGFWLAARVPGESERIPSSAQTRWEQAVGEVDGWGIVGLARRWAIGPEGSQLDAQTTSVVMREGFGHLIDRTMLVGCAPCRLALGCDASAGGTPVPLLETELTDEVLPGGELRFHKVIAPAVGSFPSGSLVRVELAAEFSGGVFSDAVHVERPTRHVLFRLETSGRPAHLPPAHLSVFAVGDGLGDLTTVGEAIAIEPRQLENGTIVVEHLIEFPPPNTLYRLDWDAAW